MNRIFLKFLTFINITAVFSMCLSYIYIYNNNIENVSLNYSKNKINVVKNNNSTIIKTKSNKFEINSIPSSDEMDSDTKWVNSIKETQANNTITLIFTRNASLVYQQSTLVTNYLLEQNDYSNKTNIMKNEIAFFVDADTYTHGKFDFSKYDELNNDYEKSQFKLIKNLKDINSDSKDEKYFATPTPSMLKAILEFYKNKYNSNISFDIWIPDLSFESLWGRYNSSEEWYELLQYTNHIYLTSDGNAQTFSFVENYINWLKKQTTDINELNKTTLEKLQKIFDKTNKEQSYETYKQSILWDYIRTNLFTTFHISRYIDSPYYKTKKEFMYPAYSFNYDYYDLSNKLFTSNNKAYTKINDSKKQNFINNYEQFFKVKDSTLSDFVYKGFENYDPTKKNIIWIGDSLIREANHVNEKRKNEIQDTFLGITKKYPVDKYNYFFKHHPYYNDRQQEELTKFISQKNNNIKPIYFKNFPWELFLSWDKKQQNTTNDYISFFSSNSNNDDIPKTQLIGIQYTSTVILSTYLFLKNNYKLEEEKSYKTINYNNFPVPGTFDIISRDLPSKNTYKMQIEINKEKTKKVYNPFLEMGYIKNYYSDQLTTEDFVKQNDINSEFYKDNSLSNNQNKISSMWIIVISICSIIVIILVSILIYFVNKKVKLKNQKVDKN